jgi:outer membrane protein assembly factor BamA
MEPAYYLGVLQFPGATKVFEYSQLLQTVNYPVEEPYEEGRVQQGREVLQRFLVRNGYFQSTVSVQVQLDQTLKLATVVYAVTLNRRARLGRIAITGTTPEEAARLEGDLHSIRARLKSANLKTGQRYNAVRLQAAEAFLRDRLGAENHLASTVRMVRPQYDTATNRADVNFNVTVGPKVVVRVTGAKVSQRELKKLVPIYQVYSVDRELAGARKRLTPTANRRRSTSNRGAPRAWRAICRRATL